MKTKHSKAFRDYKRIIEGMDLEKTTEVELCKLEEELVYSDEISNTEFCLLLGYIDDLRKGGKQ